MPKELIVRRKVSFLFVYLVIIFFNYSSKTKKIQSNIAGSSYDYDTYLQFLQELKVIQKQYFFSKKITKLQIEILQKIVSDKKIKEHIVQLIFLSKYYLDKYDQEKKIYRTLGECFFLLGEKEYKNSLYYYQQYIKKLEKVSFYISLRLIFINFKLQNYEWVEAFCEQQLQNYPNNIDIYYYYVQSIFQQKKNIKAYQKIKTLLKNESLKYNEKTVKIFSLLFFLLKKFNLNTKIEYYYRIAIEISDYEFQFVKSYSNFLLQQKQKGKSIQIAEEAYKKKKNKKYLRLLKKIYRTKV